MFLQEGLAEVDTAVSMVGECVLFCAQPVIASISVSLRMPAVWMSFFFMSSVFLSTGLCFPELSVGLSKRTVWK